MTEHINNMPATRSTTTTRFTHSSHSHSGCLHHTMKCGRKNALEGQNAPETKDQCFWTSDDEMHLIQFITTHQAKGGDGMNFNKTFWASTSTEMAKHTTQGAPKTSEACQQKWTRVSPYHIASVQVCTDRTSSSMPHLML